jgi:oxygen-dependent protoporphyrinogen oxidase
MQAPRIVIVGAGISGLAVAYHLQRLVPSAQISVLERDVRPGGTIWSERQAGFLVEYGPNGFLPGKPSTLSLCRSLDLERFLVEAGPAARHRYLLLDGRLHRLPEGVWSFLTTPILSWRSKLAVVWERFRHAPPPQTEESVHDFFCRRTTVEIAETLADALVTGIHAGDPRLLSMAAAFPRLAQLERQWGSLTRAMRQLIQERRAASAGRLFRTGSQFLSFAEGMRTLIEALVQRLRTPPLLGVCVTRVSRTKSGSWQVQAEGRDAWPADAVVLACPAYCQAEMLADLDRQLAEEVAGIPYSPAVVVTMGFRQEAVPGRLDGFGYLVPQRLRADVLGSQWCSSIFPQRAPPGCVVLRAICGGWQRPDVVSWDEERLLASVRGHYRQVLGITAMPVFHAVVRWPKAIPQYHVGHLQRLERIAARLAQYRGLFLTGNAYHGVALNDCTEQGEMVAQAVARYVGGAVTAWAGEEARPGEGR